MTTYTPTEAELWAGRIIACCWNVVPIRPGSKVAAVEWRRWQTERQIEGDPDELDARIREWWGGSRPYNLGIITGRGSRLVVIDCDSPEAVELVERTCDGWPRTVEVRTPKGRHVYYARPDRGDYPNRVRAEGHALDVRGDGGLVVCPPSVHPSGEPYRWANSPLDVWPLAPLPDALRELLWPERPEPSMVRLSPRGGRSSSYVEGALGSTCERVRLAPVGTRNDTLNREAHSVFRFVRSGELDARHAGDALEAAATAAGLPRDEARRTIASALMARLG